MKRIFITIYILLLLTLFIVPFGISPIIEQIFEADVEKAQRDLSKGTFSLIAERLVGLDEAHQKEELATLQSRFGYPLGLYRLDQLQIDEQDKKDLFNGQIIEEDEKDMLVRRLGSSDRALTMGGPFPGDDLNFKATLIFWGLLIVFLTLPALAWTFFLNRNIKNIEKTTVRFAAGDHSARVKVTRISSLSQIATAVNTMAEKIQKLLESQKELSNSVSHEIRTPLSRIKFSLEMLLDATPQKDHEKKYIAEIGKDVEEIESLVNEMLTYAKFEREPDRPGGLSKNEMVSWLKNIIHIEHKNIPDKDIIFRTNPETDRFIIRFEPVYLGWAVRNLIRNASKYAGKTVEVIFEPGKDICFIHVDDDGPGIPVIARDQIFEPFFRLDGSRQRESGGYGLGLAIAKRIAIWHNGAVSVGESPSLKGARFTLHLPVTTEA
ncbi:MAG: hypothetical protein KKE44_18100 [Proteobacteria bacterium]|nr:hypothetical protein [Pseudomonadota bacterium]MBU1584645.1 hypothetical protein [Pseudomonadota bacterium]MBU2452504.1 hypothetical protein [Pseudomonadota bacterium]MBU2629546.1 hypothetical protein [Pseudomonadota bacterium]